VAATLLSRSIQAVIAGSPRRAAAMERILRVIEENGPRKKSIVLGLSEQEDCEGETLEQMLAIGLLVPIGKTRGVVYGTPRQARARRKSRTA